MEWVFSDFKSMRSENSEGEPEERGAGRETPDAGVEARMSSSRPPGGEGTSGGMLSKGRVSGFGFGFQNRSRRAFPWVRVARGTARSYGETVRHLLDIVGDAIFVLAMQGVILHVNTVAVEALGFSRDTLVGMELRGLMEPRGPDGGEAPFGDILSGRAESVTIPVVTRSGNVLQ